MRDASGLQYIHTDHLNSTTLLTDNEGNPLPSAPRFYAYGRERSSNSVQGLPTEYAFTGQRFDNATGLVYMNARYYDPEMGVFISPDTIVPDAGNVFDYNRYMYARGNPIKYNDPNGHCPAPPTSIGPSICMALFIKPETVQAGPFTVHGDGRDFSSNSDPGASRGYTWIGLDTNYVQTHMNPSGYAGKSMQGQFPFSDGSPTIAYDPAAMDWVEPSQDNQWNIARGKDGSITVSYDLVISGILHEAGAAPHINGTITFTPNGKGGYGSSFERDGFPWAEAYYHDGKGGVQTIFQDPAVNADPFDLFAIEPAFQWYQPIAASYLFQRVQQGRPPITSNRSNSTCQTGSPC